MNNCKLETEPNSNMYENMDNKYENKLEEVKVIEISNMNILQLETEINSNMYENPDDKTIENDIIIDCNNMDVKILDDKEQQLNMNDEKVSVINVQIITNCNNK